MPDARWVGRGLQRLVEAAEQRGVETGVHVSGEDTRQLLEATTDALRWTWRELEDLGWQVLDVHGGQPQETTAASRRKMVAKARVAWLHDPQAGAFAALMNDFSLGRGVPRPRCKDELVQEIVDEAWDDRDNQRVLTSFNAQLALNTDLSLQANLFPLGFDDGRDGRFKLGLLNHDDVDGAVRDPENRLRVLYYLAKHARQEWDFKNDRPKMDVRAPKVLYYEAWGAVDEAREERELAPEGADLLPLEEPPAEKLGRGKVFHVAVNRTSEMQFGWPEMARTIRWFSAYNDLMASRVDVAKAVAALIMKRKVKGSPDQLARTAARYLSRESPLSAAGLEVGAGPGPRPASILNENENVTHEPFNLDSRAANAAQDARMIGAQVSAGHRFPRSYFGDQEAGSLATATSMELPVLKAVEARQEVLEGLFRWFIDAVVEKAVEDGRIPKRLTREEVEERRRKGQLTPSELMPEGERQPLGPDGQPLPAPGGDGAAPLQLRAAGYQDAHDDEELLERDLSYDFSMPSPLRRQMPELVSAVTSLATTFDPDNTNVELSRALLTIALSEALEVADAADIVEKVFPPGYKTMATRQFEQQQRPEPNPFGEEAQGAPLPSGEGGQAVKPGPDGKPPGGVGGARPAELAYPQMQQALREGRVTRRRDGSLLLWPERRPPTELEEGDGVVVGSLEDLPEDVRVLTRNETREQSDDFDRDVLGVAIDALSRVNGAATAPDEGG